MVFKSDCDPLAAVGTMLDHLHQQGIKTRDLGLAKMANSEVAHLQITLARELKRETVDDILSHNGDILHFEWGE